MYKLRFCLRCNLYKISCTSFNMYICWACTSCNLYLSVEQCILMSLFFEIHKINISNLYIRVIHSKLYFSDEKANY